MSSHDPIEIDLTPENPWRPVDWRWQRALRLQQKEFRRNNRFDDLDILNAVKFVDASRYSDGDRSRSTILALRHPDMYWAVDMFNNADAAWRYEVEARILANESIAEISSRMNMRPGAMEVYERLFYDVRPRLKHSSYILHIAIGPALHKGLRESDYHLIWKYYAFTYGPRMLDAVIQQAIAPGRPRTADEVRGTFQDDGISSVLRKQAIAARTVNINAFTQIDVLSVYAKFVEIERVTGQDRTVSTNTLMANVQKMMGMLPLCVGGPGETEMDDNLVASYDRTGTDLPTRQLLLAASGHVPDPLYFDNLTYPEPINHASTEPTS